MLYMWRSAGEHQKSGGMEVSGCVKLSNHFLISDSRIHVFADLQPYICSFADCKHSSVTFTSRKMWAEHELRNHRSREVLHCWSCNEDFDLEQGYLDHFNEHHKSDQDATGAEWQTIPSGAKLSIVRDMGHESCNICCRVGFETQRDFINHVGRHMEEIALITLPREVDSDDEAGEDSSTSVKIVEVDDRWRVTPSNKLDERRRQNSLNQKRWRERQTRQFHELQAAIEQKNREIEALEKDLRRAGRASKIQP